MRAIIVSLISVSVLATACDDARSRQVKEDVKSAAKKVDQALDDLDTADVERHLANARDAIGRGVDAVEDCAWAATIAGDVAREAVKARSPIDELRRLCRFDAPLGRATRAVAKAERARAEQPEAPSLTECQSDDYARAARELDAAYASEPRWTAVKTRWANVCPGP
jgi:predicted small secreted protein